MFCIDGGGQAGPVNRCQLCNERAGNECDQHWLFGTTTFSDIESSSTAAVTIIGAGATTFSGNIARSSTNAVSIGSGATTFSGNIESSSTGSVSMEVVVSTTKKMSNFSMSQGQLINSLGLEERSGNRAREEARVANMFKEDKYKGQGKDKEDADKGKGKGNGPGSSSDNTCRPWAYTGKGKDGSDKGKGKSKGQGEWINGRWFPPLQWFQWLDGRWELESRCSSWSGERSDTSEESKPAKAASRAEYEASRTKDPK